MDDYINGLFPLVREYQMRELARMRVDIKDQLQYRKRVKFQLATAYQPEVLYNQARNPHRQPRRLQRLLSSFEDIRHARAVIELPPVNNVYLDDGEPDLLPSVADALQNLDDVIPREETSFEKHMLGDLSRSSVGSLRSHLLRSSVPPAPIPKKARKKPTNRVSDPKEKPRSASASLPDVRPPARSSSLPPTYPRSLTPTNSTSTSTLHRDVYIPSSPSGVLKPASRPDSPTEAAVSLGNPVRSKSRASASSPKVVRIFTKDDLVPTKNDGLHVQRLQQEQQQL